MLIEASFSLAGITPPTACAKTSFTLTSGTNTNDFYALGQAWAGTVWVRVSFLKCWLRQYLTPYLPFPILNDTKWVPWGDFPAVDSGTRVSVFASTTDMTRGRLLRLSSERANFWKSLGLSLLGSHSLVEPFFCCLESLWFLLSPQLHKFLPGHAEMIYI